ncbi:MAG: hypothetical protein LCI02_28775 [Proteobacteria bacterium]|nr:hypothetical protein [Pseudomonadota bacterium]
MHRSNRLISLAAVLAAAALAGCAGPQPPLPARNPWLTDSVYPISHDNPAATHAVTHAGPTRGGQLKPADVKTVPAVFTSNPTVKKVDGQTIVIAAGLDGVRKILATGERFDLVGLLPYPGLEALVDKGRPAALQAVLAEADAARRAHDDAAILALSRRMAEVGFARANIPNGAYNMIDKDGFHYAAFGGLRLLKSTDDNQPLQPLRVVKAKNIADDLPPELARSVTVLVGLGMTYDGHIAAVAKGALFLLDRDLVLKGVLPFPGETVENSLSIDEQGIYVVTSKRMLKVVWTGSRLSIDEADGGWQSAYNTMPPEQAAAAGSLTLSGGSGTTPALMGFGDDADKLVIIADGDPKGTQVVAFWRDKIPPGFVQKPGTASRRIADQIRTDISNITIEPSPAIYGRGVVVLGSAFPQPVPNDIWGNAIAAGVTRPAPTGVQKFEWNPRTRSFEKAWVNREIDNTDVMVPVISIRSGLIYLANKQDGNYQYVGLDWNTGAIKARWSFPDDGRQWNAWGGITALLEDGDLMIGGLFAIKRVNVGDWR